MGEKLNDFGLYRLFADYGTARPWKRDGFCSADFSHTTGFHLRGAQRTIPAPDYPTSIRYASAALCLGWNGHRVGVDPGAKNLAGNLSRQLRSPYDLPAVDEDVVDAVGLQNTTAA